MDINETTLLGTIDKIGGIQTLKNGHNCCWLEISTSVPYTTKNNTVQNNEEIHQVLVFGNYADIIKQRCFLKQKIFLSGRLKTNHWVHNDMSFQKTFIVLERFKIHKTTESNTTNENQPDDEDQNQQDEYWNNGQQTNSESEDEGDEDLFEDMDDGSVERMGETGWVYGDIKDVLEEYGFDSSDITSK